MLLVIGFEVPSWRIGGSDSWELASGLSYGGGLVPKKLGKGWGAFHPEVGIKSFASQKACCMLLDSYPGSGERKEMETKFILEAAKLPSCPRILFSSCRPPMLVTVMLR